ncbi:MAG: PQQ-dependent sugar dehydrogenase [Pseudonocardiaceae bacterium]
MAPLAPAPGRPLARIGLRVTRLPLGLLAVAALLAGCSQLPEFPEQGSGQWRPKPEVGPQAGPQPQIPGAPGLPGAPNGPGKAPGPPPGPPEGCSDPDPAVVATCLQPISAIAVLPGGQSALVAERTTGRILRVERGIEPVEVASLPVDTTDGGGLTGLALSPSYGEDELIYAYVTTPTENQVVRIAPGDVPKPVLAGIPRGPTGNAGALGVDPEGALVVATGDAGSPAAASDPASLAGKVLRIDGSGSPAAGNPDPSSAVLTGGLHAPGGLCTDPVAGDIWVTDSYGTRDLLHRVVRGQPPVAPAWTWPERPGAAGCAVAQGRVQVALTSTGAMFALGLGPAGTFIGQPQIVPLQRYGRVAAAAPDPDGITVWLATVNKTVGNPISSDERVFQLVDMAGGGGQD